MGKLVGNKKKHGRKYANKNFSWNLCIHFLEIQSYLRQFGEKFIGQSFYKPYIWSDVLSEMTLMNIECCYEHINLRPSITNIYGISVKSFVFLSL